MSQRFEAAFTCPFCEDESNQEFFRTIWGEVPANRELVFSDKINRINCPKCHRTSFVHTSLMYTNSEQHFAVWFEPDYDPQIDSDNLKWAELFRLKGGAYSYLATAPRIREWDQFKELLRKFETGELKTDAQTVRDRAAKSEPQKGGCLLLIFVALTAVSVVLLLRCQQLL